jgi:hypothetical protein
MISVVVLQNRMDLLKGEIGSSNKTCVTSTVDGSTAASIEDERVTSVTEKGDQEPTTISAIKTEPNESCVPVVSVTYIIGCIQNCLPLYHCVFVKRKFDYREWILSSF